VLNYYWTIGGFESDSATDIPRITYTNEGFSMEPGATSDEGSKKKKKKKELGADLK